MIRIASLPAILVLGMLITAGCGGDPARKYHVKGTVTHKGAPVPYGTIIFDPDRAAGNSGPQGVADIVDGQFDTSSGEGVVGGPYSVVIRGFSAQPDVTSEEIVKPLFPENKQHVDLPQASTKLDFDIE